MDLVLKELTGTEWWTFIDDVVIYSDTTEEHAKKLTNVFERFRSANLQFHPEKCFCERHGYILGI